MMPKLWRSRRIGRQCNVPTRRIDTEYLHSRGFRPPAARCGNRPRRAGVPPLKLLKIWIRRPVPSYSYFSTCSTAASSTSASRSQGSWTAPLPVLSVVMLPTALILWCKVNIRKWWAMPTLRH